MEIRKALQEVRKDNDKSIKKKQLVIISDDEEDVVNNGLKEDDEDDGVNNGLKEDDVHNDDLGFDQLKLSGSDEIRDVSPQKHHVDVGQDFWPNSTVHYYDYSSPKSSKADKVKHATLPTTPSRRSHHIIAASDIPSHVLNLTSATKEVMASPSPPFSTPGRRGRYNAYVVYSGSRPYFYDTWSKVARLQIKHPDLVLKGFPDLRSAEAAYTAAKSSGVIDAMQKGEGRGFWVVTEGFRPGVYPGAYDALRDGLKWGGGFVTPFADETRADEFWNRQVDAKRIVSMPDPHYVD
ncbi:MAG: hypothetical protein NXY57DRAFT_969376 [Lentinula lateritia]|nr:MAG: hypothetical protein NXY57DRAFT_969376 [Lentinula lateritia]